MPLGKYPDFDTCVADQKRNGHSQISAQRICGYLEKKLNGSTGELSASQDSMVKSAIDYDECYTQAKEYGHDDDSADRICTSIAEDVQEDIFEDRGKQQQDDEDESDEGDSIGVKGRMSGNLQYQNAPTYDNKLQDYDMGEDAIDWNSDEEADYNEKAETKKIDLSYYDDDINLCVEEQVKNGLSQEDARKFCQSLPDIEGDGGIREDDELDPVKYENREYITGSDTGSHTAAAAAAAEPHPKMIEQCVKLKMKHDDSLSEEDATAECEKSFKGAYYSPEQTTSRIDDDPLEGGDKDNPDFDYPDVTPSEDQDVNADFDEPQEYDLGNDGPTYDHFGNEVYNEANTSDADDFDLDHNSTIDDNDHIDTHMSDEQSSMYDDNMEDVPQEDDNESMQGLGMDNSPDNIKMKEGPAYETSKGVEIGRSNSAGSAPEGASVVYKVRSASQVPVTEDGKIQPFTQNDKLFVKAFILDASVNKNAWGVSPVTLDRNIRTYVGKPLVMQENFDHPIAADDNLQHQLEYQELFRIGNIVDVVKKGSEYHAIAEVTNDYAKRAFKEGDLPLYVSPQLYKLDYTEPDDNMTRWVGTHLAIVKEPAYTEKKATINGECTGQEHQCMTYLKKAAIVKKEGYGATADYNVNKALLSILPNRNTIVSE